FGSAPVRVVIGQTSDQQTDFFGDFGSATAGPGPPTPVAPETGAMPADHGFGLHDEENIGPAGPQTLQGSPEQPAERSQSGTWSLAIEDGNLLAESKNFQGDIATSTEEDATRGKQRQDEFEHEPPL